MSRLHLLDTNALSVWMDVRRSGHQRALAGVEELGDAFVYLSVVTVAEVEYGVACNPSLASSLVDRFRLAIDRFATLELDRHVAEPYAKIRAWLFERFSPRPGRSKAGRVSELAERSTDLSLGIQENDLWLASHAITLDAVLVTSDRHFGPGSRIGEAARAVGERLSVSQW